MHNNNLNKDKNSVIKKYSLLFPIVILGILLRIIFATFNTNRFDFTNIMTISASIITTGNVNSGVQFLRDNENIVVQLYGKIYYQIIAGWIILLGYFGLINFDSFATIGSLFEGFAKYQVMLIKNIQFVYDLMLLFFLLKLSMFFSPRNSLRSAALFWAINPYFIYTGYVAFQSDLAMLAFFLGGMYFGLLSPKQKTVTSYQAFMAIFLGIGAAFKLVPAIFILPLLIILSKRVRSIINNLLIFVASFLLISQPWSSDYHQFKDFFYVTSESTAILTLKLLNIPLFLLFYVVLLIGIFAYRRNISHRVGLIKICLILFSLIYIFEPSQFLFAHLNIWILPFIFIVSLVEPRFIVFLIAPIIGFYKWIIIYRIETLFKNVDILIIYWLLQIIFVGIYTYFIYYTIHSFHKKDKKIFTPKYEVVLSSLFLLHIIFLLVDKAI